MWDSAGQRGLFRFGSARVSVGWWVDELVGEFCKLGGSVLYGTEMAGLYGTEVVGFTDLYNFAPV